MEHGGFLCVLHISYVQHLLDSLWILFWMIACWHVDEELMWLVCAVFASFVCLAVKMLCIQKLYHPEELEDQLQNASRWREVAVIN